MKEFICLPYDILTNVKYKRSDAWAEFVLLTIWIWLLWVWLQIGWFLFEFSPKKPWVWELISWLFSYYVALLPTIFLSSKSSRKSWLILMVVLIIVWTLSLSFRSQYTWVTLFIQILITLITLLCWTFINHDRFLKDPRDVPSPVTI